MGVSFAFDTLNGMLRVITLEAARAKARASGITIKMTAARVGVRVHFQVRDNANFRDR